MNPNVKQIVIVSVICAIILGLILGLVFFFKKKKKNGNGGGNGGGTPPPAPGPMIGLIYKIIPHPCASCGPGSTTAPGGPTIRPCRSTGAGVFYNVTPLPKTLNKVLPQGLTSATFTQLQTLKKNITSSGTTLPVFPGSMIAIPNSNTVQLIGDGLNKGKPTPAIPLTGYGGQQCYAAQFGSFVWVVGPSNAFKPSNLGSLGFAVNHPFLYPLVSQ